VTLRGELRSGAGFLRGLRPYLRRGLDLPAALRQVESQLAAPELSFADVLREAVFARPDSPYRALFGWAGIAFDDVVSLLAEHGVEATLERLHDAGVYVTLEEFKGVRPIERPGLELRVRPEDFDNPLTANAYEARTGGSSGAARAILIDLDLLAYESVYHALCFASAGVAGRPLAIWHPAPPGGVGLKTALIQLKLGHPPERWFSQAALRSRTRKYAALTRAVVLAARLSRAHIPTPEHTPARDARQVAHWLAERRPAILVTTPSSAVRTCSAALEAGLDVEGTTFVLVGEPYTPEKAAVIAATGSRAFCHYAMTEAGAIGIACHSPVAPDDVHLLPDKIGTIAREKRVGQRTVPALFHTALLPASPKVMVNVESGDFGVLEERDCGCGALPAGFRRHLHTIRSYEKLTSEGMNFLGADLLRLLEHVLPARFGGQPTDYQLVEEEEAGLPTVRLVVRKAVGELDEREVVDEVLGYLRGRGHGQALMANVWADGRTLRVVRQDPHVTPGGKIQALQTLAG
jgi:hypothetical protein